MTIRHMDNDTVLLTEVNNSGQYVIQRVQCLHNGTYQCSADNTQIPGTKTTSASLDVSCYPRRDVRKSFVQTLAREINETASMVADVIANPLPSFTWWRSIDGQLEPIRASTVHTVSSTDLQTTLQIHITHARDYGKYAVRMKNSVGASTITYSLSPISVPLAPDEVRFNEIGYTKVNLQWKSNYNGGSLQTFLLDYRLAEGDSNWAIWKTGIQDPGIHKIVLSDVTGLKSNTKYQFRVYSRNIYGTSEKVTRTTTTNTNESKLAEDRLGPGIGIGIGISLPVMILLFVLLVMTSRRNSNKGKNVPGTAQSSYIQSNPDEANEPGAYSSLNQQTSQNNVYERIQMETPDKALNNDTEHTYRNMTSPYEK